MKYLICLFLIVTGYQGFAQKGFAEWDARYPVVSVQELLEQEAAYAKKVEADTTEAPYYVRMEGFRFLGRYTRKKRPIAPDVKQSMKNVLQLRGGNAGLIEELVSWEVAIQIGKETLWMPIQDSIIEAFEKEAAGGKEVLLYTLFTNEHTHGGQLFNTFLISEFTTEWTP